MARALSDILKAFDGQHVAPLGAALDGPLDAKRLLEELPGPHEVAASWLLKALAEQERLALPDLAAMLARVSLLRQGDAILHVLQSATFAPAQAARAMRPDLEHLHAHHKGLVRVWAFDAWLRGARLPQESDAATARIRKALEAPEAAMRARARAWARTLNIAP